MPDAVEFDGNMYFCKSNKN